MKLKLQLALLGLLSTSLIFARPVELPLGGKISIDLGQWNVQRTDSVPGSNSLMILHRKHKDLYGIVFDGTIKDEAPCGKEGESSPSAWTICAKKVQLKGEVSYQIFSQRKLAPNVYQTYIYAFNYPLTKEKEYLPQLHGLKGYMEANK